MSSIVRNAQPQQVTEKQVIDIAVLAGDGIGPEVMAEAIKVLNALATHRPYTFNFKRALAGGAAFDVYGSHLPEETAVVCEESRAILFGSVGGPISEAHLPKWQGCETNSILALRKRFSFGSNLRPIRLPAELKALSPLREERIGDGIDLLIVRELLGDCYFGEKRRESINGQRVASDAMEYSEAQIANVTHHACRAALLRRGKLCLVHKANVLATSKLWREVVPEIVAQYPGVSLEEQLVDSCAMRLITHAPTYDVVLTSNMFGDILSDLASCLPGSLGLSPSASLTSNSKFGLFEPAGGSAPDIANTGRANPTAQILSAAMMLSFSLDLAEDAKVIEEAVFKVIAKGIVTPDLAIGHQVVGAGTPKQAATSLERHEQVVSTSAFGDAVAAEVGKI